MVQKSARASRKKARKTVKQPTKKTVKKTITKKLTRKQRLAAWAKDLPSRVKASIGEYLVRRPHRSFKLSRRRDYRRSFKMPSYFGFTRYVLGQIREAKWTFRLLTLFSVVAIALLVGVMSQDIYTSLQDALSQTSENIVGGQISEVGKAALLLLSTATTGGINQAPTEIQQVFSVLIFMIVWLTTVWLLRNRLSGNKVRLRDGLYNACAPLISTALVMVVLFIQLIPAIIALVAYSAAVATDFLATPLYAIVFWVAAGGLGLLSLFLVVSSLFALVVVTIPGMYPFRAIKIAGDLVTSRRLRVIYRLAWMFLNIVVFWVITMIPIIIFDGWFRGAVEWAAGWPIVPISLLVVSSMSVIFASSYIYLLYRRLIADDADPA